MSCNTFICTILFGLLDSSKIILFKDIVEKIIEAKVAENGFILLFKIYYHLKNFIQNELPSNHELRNCSYNCNI